MTWRGLLAGKSPPCFCGEIPIKFKKLRWFSSRGVVSGRRIWVSPRESSNSTYISYICYIHQSFHLRSCLFTFHFFDIRTCRALSTAWLCSPTCRPGTYGLEKKWTSPLFSRQFTVDKKREISSPRIVVCPWRSLTSGSLWKWWFSIAKFKMLVYRRVIFPLKKNTGSISHRIHVCYIW